MKLIAAFSLFAGFLSLINCSEFTENFNEYAGKLANSGASTTDIITESSASASSQTAPIDEPPRISFFGISNWDRVLEVDENPLIFISGLQEQTEQFKCADQRIRFGLAINDEEAEILLNCTCTESQLADFLGMVKDGFESFTGRPLKYCLFRRAMIGAVEDAMTQLGIKCFVAHAWSCASEQENQTGIFYFDTSNTDVLNELKH